MKIISPFGEYPFEFRRIERRGSDVVLVGTVAGIESGMTLEARDLAVGAAGLAAALALSAGIALARRSRRQI